MTNTQWWKYVESVASEDTPTEIANRAGFDKSNITRWKQGFKVDPGFVVRFARAYNRPAVEALAACGLITPEEANVREVAVGISDLTDRELLTELSKRLDRFERMVDELDTYRRMTGNKS